MGQLAPENDSTGVHVQLDMCVNVKREMERGGGMGWGTVKVRGIEIKRGGGEGVEDSKRTRERDRERRGWGWGTAKERGKEIERGGGRGGGGGQQKNEGERERENRGVGVGDSKGTRARACTRWPWHAPYFLVHVHDPQMLKFSQVFSQPQS